MSPLFRYFLLPHIEIQEHRKMLFWLLLWLSTGFASAADFDENVPLNHYQWIGSHNSYKRALPDSVYQLLSLKNTSEANQLNYAHLSLNEQLSLGLRQLEIDVVNDPSGNQYQQVELASRLNENWLSAHEVKQLAKPGFKVMHIPHVDVMTHCATLKVCLKQLNAWSAFHPEHFPIVVMMNAKETQPDFLKSNKPVLFDEAAFASLDEAIRSGLPGRLVTPDDIRGNAKSLQSVITNNGWPSVKALRGKFIFLFDGNEKQLDRYTQGQNNLKGRSMFASFEPGHPSAAIMIRNNPINQQQDIRQLVESGYLVRTRADANLSASNEQKALQRDAAFQSGAQLISTDFYSQSPQAKRTQYSVHFEQGRLMRTNPINY
ncbi:MAG: hypothetical protein JXQ95_07800 [Alteromonas stellipolaris]|uniref:Ca2+-dependent phosphoinositide-specific phospholipase C n=1 Tax=Alteromonas stellipolaris TaxID=233316 RepID=UPI003B8D1D40